MPPFSSQSTGQPGKGVRTDVGRDHGNINVVASRTRWSLEARGSEVASGAAAASGALETETGRWRGVGAPTRGARVGWGRGPWRAAGRGPARPQLREHIGLKASRVVLERVTIAGFQYFLAGSDPGQRVQMAAPTGRDGVSFYTLVPGEGGWDSCLPVATRRPCRQAQGRRRGARKRCARELCSRETPALRQRQTWRKRGKLP